MGEMVRWSEIEDFNAWFVGVGAEVTLRFATPADEDRIFNCLIAFHQEGALPYSFSPKKLRARIKEGTEAKGGIIGIIDAPDGRVAATVGIWPHQVWYSDEFLLSEMWFYVRKEFRGAGFDKLLFDFSRAYQADIGARMGRKVSLICGIFDNRRLKAKVRLFARFARQVGAVFIREG